MPDCSTQAATFRDRVAANLLATALRWIGLIERLPIAIGTLFYPGLFYPWTVSRAYEPP